MGHVITQQATYPMLAAIERHRKARQRFETAITREDELESDIPQAVKRAAKKEWNAAEREERSARFALARTAPSSAADLLSMINYIETFNVDGGYAFFDLEDIDMTFFRMIKKYVLAGSHEIKKAA